MLPVPRIVRVPASFVSELDALTVFDGYPLTDNFKRRLKLFYGYLIERQASSKKLDWIRLHSTEVRKRIHQRAYQIGVNYLVERELIQVTEGYCVDEYPRGYRIFKQKFGINTLMVDLVEYPNRLSELKLCPSISEVSFDLKEIQNLREMGTKLEDGKEKGWRKFCWDLSLDKVLRKDWSVSTDEKTGRIFTNVTSMPKEMRHRILIGGMETVEIDVANSQPFLSLCLYPENSRERKEYLKLVTSGLFYETLKDGLDADRQKRIKNRERLKERVYQEVFFGMDSPRYAIWKVFKNLFPELGAIFAEFKKPEVEGMRKSNRLSLKLQKAEADIVIKGVLAECISEGISLLTVHDSVICKKSDQTLVMGKFKAHLLQSVGVLPKLRTT